MKQMAMSSGACALICALSIPAIAHDPPDYRGIIWQWPADKLPVFDGDLSDWDIVPEEFWLTHENYNVDSYVGANESKAGLDPSDLSFRWMTSFVQGSSKLYWAYERYDDYWFQSDDIEPTIDADHSGGNFWQVEGMSDEEAARNRSRHAQIYHLWFDDGLFMGDTFGDNSEWVWMWMTSADWYGELPYTNAAYTINSGTPGNGEEFSVTAEFMLTAWDDFNYQDPEGSVEHFMMEGEVIGLSVNVWDHDGEDPMQTARWSLTSVGESNVNADYLADFVLTEIDEELMATAVEEDSWGNVKASVAK